MGLLRRVRQELVDDQQEVQLAQRLPHPRRRRGEHERVVADDHQRPDPAVERAFDDAVEVEACLTLHRHTPGTGIRRDAHIAGAVDVGVGRQHVEGAGRLPAAQQQRDVSGALRRLGSASDAARIRRVDDRDALLPIARRLPQDLGRPLKRITLDARYSVRPTRHDFEVEAVRRRRLGHRLILSHQASESGQRRRFVAGLRLEPDATERFGEVAQLAPSWRDHDQPRRFAQRQLARVDGVLDA